MNYYFQFVGEPWWGIHPGILGLIVNVLVMVGVSYASSPPSRQEVDVYVGSGRAATQTVR